MRELEEERGNEKQEEEQPNEIKTMDHHQTILKTHKLLQLMKLLALINSRFVHT